MIDLTREKELLREYGSLLGIDEAGRGPWAGPVVIAGVLITRDTSNYLPLVNDSKKLTQKRRRELYQQLIQIHPFFISIIDSERIDSIGIGNAIIEGMREVISQAHPSFTIIDGYFKKGSFPKNTTCIIDGDALCYSIAAASIIAKQTRDDIMLELDKQYPEYQFAQHKGYGTKLHQELLERYGTSAIHRKSYRPVKRLLDKLFKDISKRP